MNSLPLPPQKASVSESDDASVSDVSGIIHVGFVFNSNFTEVLYLGFCVLTLAF